MVKTATLEGEDLKYIWKAAKSVLEPKESRAFINTIKLKFENGNCHAHLTNANMLADFSVPCTGDDFTVFIPYTDLPSKAIKDDVTVLFDDQLLQATFKLNGQQISILCPVITYPDFASVVPNGDPKMVLCFDRERLIRMLQSMNVKAVSIDIREDDKPIIAYGNDPEDIRLLLPMRKLNN